MKDKMQFILLYLMLFVIMTTFYMNANSSDAKRLEIKNLQLDGLHYIQLLHKVGEDLVHALDTQDIGYKEKSRLAVEDDLKSLALLQNEWKQFENKELLDKLKHTIAHSDAQTLNELFLYLNHENYRVGDVSKLLFEEDRELYFLGSLLTHYMPEYIASILLRDNIVQNFVQRKTLSAEEKTLYVEHYKLIVLSFYEVFEIVELLQPSNSKEKMLQVLQAIEGTLEQMKQCLSFSETWSYDENNIAKYFNMSKELFRLSNNFNVLYMTTLKNRFTKKRLSLKQSISLNQVIYIGSLIFFAILVLYFYRLRLLNRVKETEIKSINNELDEVVLFSKTDTSGVITHVSEGLLQLSGYTKEELLGKNHRLFKHKDNNEKLYKEMWQTIQSKKVWSGELINTKKDGTEYWIVLTITPQLNRHGDIESYSAYRKDITDVKALEREKRKTQEALDFKSKFLSNMSHEIRTPLNAIIGLVEVTKKTDCNAKQKELLTNITHSSNILLGIINDILDISKIEAGKMFLESKAFDLQQMVTMIESFIMPKVNEKRLTLQTHFEGMEHFYYMGDALRITQVLTNLLSNAVKFTEYGEVTLHISKSKEGEVLFRVSDTGIGLKEEVIESLFHEFTQADMSTS